MTRLQWGAIGCPASLTCAVFGALGLMAVTGVIPQPIEIAANQAATLPAAPEATTHLTVSQATAPTTAGAALLASTSAAPALTTTPFASPATPRPPAVALTPAPRLTPIVHDTLLATVNAAQLIDNSWTHSPDSWHVAWGVIAGNKRYALLDGKKFGRDFEKFGAEPVLATPHIRANLSRELAELQP